MKNSSKQFIKEFTGIAAQQGHIIENSGQIFFVNDKGNKHKKLHVGHLEKLFEKNILKKIPKKYTN